MQKKYSSLMDYALRIISKKRYTISEMRKKLGGFLEREVKTGREEEDVGSDPGAGGLLEEQNEAPSLPFSARSALVEVVIARLIELNYLNDLEYAQHYIADRARFRPRGKIMIQRELMARGVGKEELQKAFAANDQPYDETASAEELMRKKERVWGCLDPKKRKEKAYRFLQSKGFGRDTIYKVLRSCYNQITE